MSQDSLHISPEEEGSAWTGSLELLLEVPESGSESETEPDRLQRCGELGNRCPHFCLGGSKLLDLSVFC